MKSFEWQGDDRPRWTANVEVIGVAKPVTARDHYQYYQNHDFRRHVRQSAAISAADFILEKAATFEVLERDNDAGFEYRWTLDVVLPPAKGRDYFAEQIKRERAAGRREAFQEAARALLAERDGRGPVSLDVKSAAGLYPSTDLILCELARRLARAAEAQ